MKTLQLVMRSDLGMRKGKMAAQAGHAAMKVLLSPSVRTRHGLSYKAEHYNDLCRFIKSGAVSVEMVSGCDGLFGGQSSAPGLVVVDNGKTEFAGVLTPTCMARGLFDDYFTDRASIAAPEGGSGLRQYFVFSKQYPISKEVACELAVRGCIGQLAHKLSTHPGSADGSRLIGNEEVDLFNWIFGGYGKIGLSVDTDHELGVLISTLEVSGLCYFVSQVGKCRMVAISPERTGVVRGLTSSLSLI